MCRGFCTLVFNIIAMYIIHPRQYTEPGGQGGACPHKTSLQGALPPQKNCCYLPPMEVDCIVDILCIAAFSWHTLHSKPVDRLAQVYVGAVATPSNAVSVL